MTMKTFSALTKPYENQTNVFKVLKILKDFFGVEVVLKYAVTPGNILPNIPSKILY